MCDPPLRPHLFISAAAFGPVTLGVFGWADGTGMPSCPCNSLFGWGLHLEGGRPAAEKKWEWRRRNGDGVKKREWWRRSGSSGGGSVASEEERRLNCGRISRTTEGRTDGGGGATKLVRDRRRDRRVRGLAADKGVQARGSFLQRQCSVRVQSKARAGNQTRPVLQLGCGPGPMQEANQTRPCE